MSRARGVRGARKMRAFAKERVAGVASEEEWEAALARAGDRLLVAEFAASWSGPCKAMAPYLTALSQQPEFRGVSFVRVDLEACAALGAKNAVLSAPTYHFYRKGALLDSFSGALPHKLMELLGKHKGDAPAQRGGLKLLALLVAVSAGVAAALVFGAQPAPPPPPPPPPQTRTDEDDREPPAAPLADEGDPQRRVAPAKKAAGEPSKGAQMA